VERVSGSRSTGPGRRLAQTLGAFIQLSADLPVEHVGEQPQRHPAFIRAGARGEPPQAVEGLSPGAYFFRREEGSLELLKEGDFREHAAYLGLEQELPGDASVAVFFLADLRRILERFGNRGYRATQLEAGILGGKLYLAAYAQRFGASGLTFFDDDVTNFFSPHAGGKSAIFLAAVGKSARRSHSAG
jgi:SagB-type dehydrogenase family enzyme